MKDLTKKEHIKRHKELHGCLDELTADFIINTDRSLSDVSIMELIHWSYEQTKNPTNKKD